MSIIGEDVCPKQTAEINSKKTADESSFVMVLSPKLYKEFEGHKTRKESIACEILCSL
jgi:hypothetical protein